MASYLQLTLDLGRIHPEAYEEALFALGALSVTLEDAADDPILEPAPGALPLWPTVRMKALFAAETDPGIVQSLARLGPLPPHRFETLAERVWEREWLKDFHPMRFGRRLWICPAGQHPAAENAVIVDLDPGLAFGSGTHATTALCLEWLDARADVPGLAGQSLVDYGCGSGILAIAALKLGVARASGVDIDPQALLASRDNAERNGVSDGLQLSLQDSSLSAADILIANILAAPLQTLASRLAELVKPGGHIVLSGLLQEQASELKKVYSDWFDMEPIVLRDGWARLSGVRHRS